MNIHRFVSVSEIGIKLGMFGASNAYRAGVGRQRVREAVMQHRVNSYAAAVLRNRAAARNAAKDARRNDVVSELLAHF